jgi:hypothetical protein
MDEPQTVNDTTTCNTTDELVGGTLQIEGVPV